MIAEEFKAATSSSRQAMRSGLSHRDEVLRSALGVLRFLSLLGVFMAVQTLILRRFPVLQETSHTALTLRDALSNAVLAIAITAATSVLATREHLRFAGYGFRSAHRLDNLLGGALAGFALLSTLVLLLHHLNLLVFRGQVLFGAALQWRLALEWIVFYALAAYVQQFLVHGYLQYTLTRGFASLLRHSSAAASGVQPGFWMAAVLLCAVSAVFQGIHGGESLLGTVNAALFGLLMAFSLWRTGSLWWALGYSTAWNWAQSFFWGMPHSGILTRDHIFLTEAAGPALRSGGTTGPEGSIYTLGALLAGFGILTLLHPRRVYPELWDEAAHGTPRSHSRSLTRT